MPTSAQEHNSKTGPGIIVQEGAAAQPDVKQCVPVSTVDGASHGTIMQGDSGVFAVIMRPREERLQELVP